MRLDLASEELGAMVAAAVEQLVREKHGEAIAAVALEMAREAALWRSAAQIREEFGIPERTLRLLVEQRKVSKSDGVGPVKYSRADIVTLLETRQIKSRTALEREREKVVTPNFTNVPARKAC